MQIKNQRDGGAEQPRRAETIGAKAAGVSPRRAFENEELLKILTPIEVDCQAAITKSEIARARLRGSLAQVLSTPHVALTAPETSPIMVVEVAIRPARRPRGNVSGASVAVGGRLVGPDPKASHGPP